jgi:acyl-CoA thioester hydrolase
VTAWRTRIGLRWRDIDMLGHLNQSVYHDFLEEGRSAVFLESDGGLRFPFVLAHVELDYRAEVRHDHEYVDVVVRIDRVGRSSVTLHHDIERSDGVVAATGHSVVVAWDPEARRSRALTDDERAALQADTAADR